MKRKNSKNFSSRQLIGIEDITEYSVKTASFESVFFSIKPDNISVMPYESLKAKIYSLTAVFKSVQELEILCLNSRESFESNKNYINRREKAEQNPAVKKLLKEDISHLDRIQAQTAAAREFLLIVRIRNMKEREIFSYINRIEKTVSENGFEVRRFGKEEIKTMLAVYYSQNVTTEKFDDFDGERWILK